MQAGIRWVSDGIQDADEDSSGRRPRLLLICDYRPREAATVIDHIEAIRRWSRSDVFVLPIFGDLPDELDLEQFDGLILHYNLIMSNAVYLSPLARWRVSQFSGVKAAFVQDEYRFVDSTVGVMRTLGIDVLFTCVPEDQVELVYPDEALPAMKRKVTVLTGYVPEELLALPVVPYEDRTVDVGYRGRRLPAWLGSLAQEKTTIADRFLADAPAFGLTTDISTSEADRLYGDAWNRFVASSKATLGVESGASVFDFDGSVEQTIRSHLATHPQASFEELYDLFLADIDGKIRLNQISPRSFEAAALGTLMVLYPGDYSGILEPGRHYVPLEKDHSNMAEVARAIQDRSTWERITAQARAEVALDPRYSFAGMVAIVDDALALAATSTKAIQPREFERLASRSYRRMRTTKVYALGLPPAVNRVRIMAVRALVGLAPSPIAISTSRQHALKGLRAWRERWRYFRSLAHWALRPHLLPPTVLLRHRGALLRELSQLGRLQLIGARARATGVKSPYVLVVGEPGTDLRLVLRGDAPASGHPLPSLPDDLSTASGITLDLTDQWLVPLGVSGSPAHRLAACSEVLRERPAVGRGLLAGETAWFDVLALDSSRERP
jgi:hypothetical protein